MELDGRDFERLKSELEKLNKLLHRALSHPSEGKQEMKEVFQRIGPLARKIGGSVWDDYEELYPLFVSFLRAPFKKEHVKEILLMIEKLHSECENL